MIASMAANVILDGLFSKSLPRNVRGTLNGVMSAMGTFGTLVFVKCAGWSFDMIGAKSPFYLVAIADLVFLLCIAFLVCCGKLSTK